MKKQIILIGFLLTLVAMSCNNNDFDCPEKTYSSQIALGNHTDYEIDVELFPKSVHAQYLYLSSDMGVVFKDTRFTMKSQQIYISDFQNVLFTTSDTSSDPKYLLNYKFDSIKLMIHDLNNTKIFISPDTCINLSQNPFKENPAWITQKIDLNMPDNDCPNPNEVKSHQFFIESINQ